MGSKPNKSNSTTNINKNNYYLNTMMFNQISKVWEVTAVKAQPVLKGDNLSFICYNIWFEEHNWDNRIKAILNIFIKYNADFICLQECTEEFLYFIKNEEFIQTNYYFSNNLKSGYDVLILCKYPVPFYRIFFESNQHRNLLLTKIHLECISDEVAISTAHFESLDISVRHRKDQPMQSFMY